MGFGGCGVAFVLSFAMVCTLLAGVNVVAFAADDELTDTVAVQKFYNDAEKGGTGEHIYTIDESEISWYQSLPSWNDEGDAWLSPLMSSTPVYRVFNPNSGEHLWITDKGYVDLLVGQGWNQEQGIAFYSDDNKGVPVYRLWDGTDNLRSHHYTTDEGEIAWLVTLGWTVEDVAFYGVKEEEPTEFEITATQTGANTILVTSTEEMSDLDDFSLMRGNLEQDISVDVDEDGLSAVITTETAIADAEYTIVVTPLDETMAPAITTFDGEAAELSAIAFVSDKFVLQDAQGTAGYAALRGFNQFGEMEILKGNVTATVAPSTAAQYVSEKGIVFATQAAGVPYVVGNSVSATAVYQDGTTILQTSATLTVSAPQTVADITFGEIHTSNVSLLGERVTHTGLNGGSYYIPVVAMDQYGIVLDAATLNGWHTAGSLIVTPWTGDQGFASVTGFDELDDGTVIMTLGDGTLNVPGTQTISVLSVGGTQGSTEVTVEAERYIDDLDVTIPEIYSGKEAVLDVYAVDQYMEEFEDSDLYDIAPTVSGDKKTVTFGDRNAYTGKGTSIQVSEGDLSVVKNPSKKAFTIKWKPAAGGKRYATVTITTATPVVSVENVTINADGEAAGIKGLKDSISTTLKNTETVNVATPGNVLFTDTYGNVMTANVPTYSATGAGIAVDSFYYSVSKESGRATAFNSATGVITAQNAGSDTYKISLYKKTANGVTTVANKSVKFTVTDGDYKMYVAGAANTMGTTKTNLYVGQVSVNGTPAIVADAAILGVYGVDSAGNMVKLTPGAEYTAVVRDDTVAGATLNVYNNQALIVTAANTGSEISVETAIVDIYDATGELQTTVEIECTNEKPSALTFMGIKLDRTSGTQTPVDLSTGIEVSSGSTIAVNPAQAVDVAKLIGHDPTYVQGYNALFINDTTSNCTYVVAAVDQYGMLSVDRVLFKGGALPGTLTTAGQLTLTADSISDVVALSVYE